VRRLVEEGYRVAAVARREALLSELCQGINAALTEGDRAFPYQHDVTNTEEIPALFQQIVRDLGGLDLIVYVAGIQPAVEINEYSTEKDIATVKTNLLGAIGWLNEAALRFERAGSGHIVGISSIAGERGRVASPVYNASKAGLNTYLEALRNRLSRHGVTVTTVKPGFVDTVLLANAPVTMWVISPDEAARQIFASIKSRRQTVYCPGRWRWVGLVIRHIPSVIFRRMSF